MEHASHQKKPHLVVKYRTLLILLFSVLFVLFGLYGIRFAQVYPKKTIGGTNIRVEVAHTPHAITQGLSGRSKISSIPFVEGMLFVLPQRGIPSFWMKDMQFALDFIWIDGNRVVDITEYASAPAPRAAIGELPIYRPTQPVTHVLEVPAGFVQAHTIKVGDEVK